MANGGQEAEHVTSSDVPQAYPKGREFGLYFRIPYVLRPIPSLVSVLVLRHASNPHRVTLEYMMEEDGTKGQCNLLAFNFSQDFG